MVCHFDTACGIPTEKWPRVINTVSPRDIAVLRAKEAPPDFHSRFWAISRSYRYRLQGGPRDPERMRYAYYFGRPLDVRAMQEAAQQFVGQHDFKAFSQDLLPEENSVRTVLRIGVRQVRDEVWIDVVAKAYCRGMMRRISGSLWEVGRGKREAESIGELLREPRKKGLHWPVVLPAAGLTLMKVSYGRHPKDRSRQFAEQTTEERFDLVDGKTE